MTVKDLIDKLSKFDPQLEIYCYCEEIHEHMGSSVVFDIGSVDEIEAERSRGKDERASLSFGKTENSEKFVLLDVTNDF